MANERARVTVDWADGVLKYDSLGNAAEEYLDEKGFYCILSGVPGANGKWNWVKLLYVGQAFDQDLRTRILQPHDAFGCVNKYLRGNKSRTALVMVGIVSRSPLRRPSQPLFDDIECCLIHRNQPLCNTLCKQSYSGRSILVKNTGDFRPLNETSRCG